MKKIIFILQIFLLLCYSCISEVNKNEGISDPSTLLQSEFNSNKTKWENLDIQNYHFDEIINYQSVFGGYTYGKRIIVVSNDIAYLQDESIYSGNYNDIDFDEIAMSNKQAKLNEISNLQFDENQINQLTNKTSISVEYFFDRIEPILTDDKYEINVLYDAQYGIPLYVYYYLLGCVDDCHTTFSLTNFVVID